MRAFTVGFGQVPHGCVLSGQDYEVGPFLGPDLHKVEQLVGRNIYHLLRLVSHERGCKQLAAVGVALEQVGEVTHRHELSVTPTCNELCRCTLALFVQCALNLEQPRARSLLCLRKHKHQLNPASLVLFKRMQEESIHAIHFVAAETLVGDRDFEASRYAFLVRVTKFVQLETHP